MKLKEYQCWDRDTGDEHYATTVGHFSPEEAAEAFAESSVDFKEERGVVIYVKDPEGNITRHKVTQNVTHYYTSEEI